MKLLKVNSLLVNDEEINGSGGEMEEAVEEEIEVFIIIYEDFNIVFLNLLCLIIEGTVKKNNFMKGKHLFRWQM